jgi:hypothetical protein
LYNWPQVEFKCDVNFYPRWDEWKYMPWVVFYKTKKDWVDKQTNAKKVRIEFNSFSKWLDQYRKLIWFLWTFKDLVDTWDFDWEYKVIDKNISDMLFQISDDSNQEIVKKSLRSMDYEKLKTLQNLVNTSWVEWLIENIKDNYENKDEVWFRQPLLKKNQRIVSQLFSSPFVFIDDEFYCWGRTEKWTGGISTDFAYKNEISWSIAFIEIKTPVSELVYWSQYRKWEEWDECIIYAPHKDTTWWVVQLLNQKHTYLETKRTLWSDRPWSHLKCFLIVWVLNKLNAEQIKSFELYRSSLHNVEVVTFDELVKRLEMMLWIFKDNTDAENSDL